MLTENMKVIFLCNYFFSESIAFVFVIVFVKDNQIKSPSSKSHTHGRTKENTDTS